MFLAPPAPRFASSGELSTLIAVCGVSVTDFFTESSLAVEIASDTKLSSWMEEYVWDSKKNRVENVLTLL